MTDDISLLDMVKDLQEAGLGDQRRLAYVVDRIEKNRIIYNSDQEYIESKFKQLRDSITGGHGEEKQPHVGASASDSTPKQKPQSEIGPNSRSSGRPDTKHRSKYPDDPSTNQPNSEHRRHNDSIKDDIPSRSSRAWYLLPIFFGIIGGIIMYVLLRKQNRSMAKKGLILGFGITIIFVFVNIDSNQLSLQPQTSPPQTSPPQTSPEITDVGVLSESGNKILQVSLSRCENISSFANFGTWLGAHGLDDLKHSEFLDELGVRVEDGDVTVEDYRLYSIYLETMTKIIDCFHSKEYEFDLSLNCMLFCDSAGYEPQWVTESNPNYKDAVSWCDDITDDSNNINSTWCVEFNDYITDENHPYLGASPIG